MHSIQESDWKLFHKLHVVALERFCERVLADVDRISADAGKTNHERYLAVYKLIKQQDKVLASSFDDMRRSIAFQQLASICDLDLLSDEEFAQFSPATQEAVQMYLSAWRKGSARTGGSVSGHD